MLRVTLLGNLGADPEIRYSQKGTQIVSFNVAVNQVRFVPNGERQENTEWFRVRSTRQIEYAQRLGKGTRVLVIGRWILATTRAKKARRARASMSGQTRSRLCPRRAVWVPS